MYVHGSQVVRVGHKKVLFTFSDQLIQDTRVKQRIVQVTVARGIPVRLVIVSCFWTGEQGLLEDARIPRLIKGGDPELLICVFLYDSKRVLMGVKRGHEDERDIDTLGSVEVLDLADSKIEECHVIFDLECTLRTGHTCREHWLQTKGFSKEG